MRGQSGLPKRARTRFLVDLMPGATAFLDFETTGTSANHAGITDIGLVVVEANGRRREWQHLVNPGHAIPWNITMLTGISDAMVKHAPPFSELADELIGHIGDARIVAHNARFDMSFLHAGLNACGKTRCFPHVCSVRVARKLFPAMKSRSLDAMAARYAITFAGERHRALPDSVMLADIWRHMRDEVGDAVFDTTADALTADRDALPVARATDEPPPWPFSGPVVVDSTRRTGEWHVFHEWCHLGTVADEADIPSLVRASALFCAKKYVRIVEALARPDAVIRPL